MVDCHRGFCFEKPCFVLTKRKFSYIMNLWDKIRRKNMKIFAPGRLFREVPSDANKENNRNFVNHRRADGFFGFFRNCGAERGLYSRAL